MLTCFEIHGDGGRKCVRRVGDYGLWTTRTAIMCLRSSDAGKAPFTLFLYVVLVDQVLYKTDDQICVLRVGLSACAAISGTRSSGVCRGCDHLELLHDSQGVRLQLD